MRRFRFVNVISNFCYILYTCMGNINHYLSRTDECYNVPPVIKYASTRRYLILYSEYGIDVRDYRWLHVIPCYLQVDRHIRCLIYVGIGRRSGKGSPRNATRLSGSEISVHNVRKGEIIIRVYIYTRACIWYGRSHVPAVCRLSIHAAVPIY